MTPITSIDKAACREITQAISDNMAAWTKEAGLELKTKSGTYDPHTGTFSLKVEFSLPGAERREFERYAEIFGLEATDFGRSFTSGSKTFVVSGVKPNSSVRPILATSGGKTYSFPSDAVARLLKKRST